MHITKVKSVNLDKWPEAKVELFHHLSNHMVNSYFEKNLPQGFKKPASNASNYEVVDFMTNKYVHKKWADTENWSNDPAWLYENKPKKFQKFLDLYKTNNGIKVEKKLDYNSDQDEEPIAEKKKPQVKQQPKAAPEPPKPEINLFDDMMGTDAPKPVSNDDGFTDFVQSSSVPASNPASSQQPGS